MTMDKLEQIKNAVTANGMREWTDERVGQAMREYADQQNAELRERVRELENLLTIWVKQYNYLRRHSISDFDDIHDQTKKSLKK